MVISTDLRVLAKKIENSSDALLADASSKGPEIFEKVAMAIAAASTLLDGVADDLDSKASFDITPQQLDEIAAVAESFDKSKNPLLQRQASVLDELLLSIAAPKNAVAQAKRATEDEITKLREEKSRARREEAYDEPKKIHSDMSNAKQQAKAVEQQVKRYAPLEAPLQTRYPPDRPGGQMTRISDGVYQDIMTGIVYDFKNGYTTQKGNQVPGGCVENQTRQLGDLQNRNTSLFETRDSILNRNADNKSNSLVKTANKNVIEKALKDVRDLAPNFIEKAIDLAGAEGLSTTEIGYILGDVNSADEARWYEKDTEAPVSLSQSDYNTVPNTTNLSVNDGESRVLTEPENRAEYNKARVLLKSLKEAAWFGLLADVIDALEGSGLSAHYLELLEREFLDNEPERKSQERISIDVNKANPHGDTVLSASEKINLVSLAINIIQEIAPHLLKSAVEKAKEDGITDEQIKLILSKENISKIEKLSFDESGEVKIAESLFPHLKSLGWNSLISDHIKVMAELGVSNRAITKLASGFLPQENSSFSRLQNLLSLAGVHEFELEDGPRIDLETPEVKPIEINMDVPEGEFEGNLALQPAIKDQNVTVPDFSFEEEDEHVESSGSVTPETDLEEWWKTYQQVLQDVKSDEALRNKWIAMQKSGQKQEAIDNYIATMNEKMNQVGFIGPGEKNANGKNWLDVAKELKAKTSGPITVVTPTPESQLRLNDKPPTIPGRLGPAIKPTEREETAKSKSEIGLNWDKYTEETGVNLTPDKIKKLEESIRKGFEKAKESADVKFNRYKYDGRPMPASVGKLPREILEKVTSMFEADETSEAVSKYLQEFIPQWLAPKMEDEIVGYRNKLEVEKNDKLAKADVAERDGKPIPAQRFRNEALSIEKRMNNDIVVAKEALSLKMSEILPPVKDLHLARETVIGPQNLANAKKLRRDYLNSLSRQTINNILVENALPPMYRNVDIMLATDFDEQLQGLAKMTPGSKGKSGFIHSYPEKLIPVWKDPQGYVNAFLLAKEMYGVRTPKGGISTKDPAIRKQIDEDMESQGYVKPYQKLFGSQGSTANMLYGVEGGNPLADFGGLKTLFSDPQEYVRKYVEGTQLFRTKTVDTPLEWKQIHGGELDARTRTDSGDTIRRMIKGMAIKGMELKEIEFEITKKFPKAFIPAGTIEKMVPIFTEHGEIKGENVAKFNDWMRKDGFYPAYEPAIGEKTFANILTGTGYIPKHAPDLVGGYSLEELKSHNYQLDKPQRGKAPSPKPSSKLPDGTPIPTQYQERLRSAVPGSPIYHALMSKIKRDAKK